MYVSIILDFLVASRQLELPAKTHCTVSDENLAYARAQGAYTVDLQTYQYVQYCQNAQRGFCSIG